MSGERGDVRKKLAELASLAGDADAQAAALRPVDRFSIRVPETTTLTIKHPDGRDLFVIHRDGTVTGDIEDAGEAAAIFVREVKRLFGADRLTTDTAAGEECPRHCGRNEPCPDPWHDHPAAPAAGEGVETVEWGVRLATGEVRPEGASHYAERSALREVERIAHNAAGEVGRSGAGIGWATSVHPAEAVRRTRVRYPDRVSEWTPVDPETSEPEGGESRGE